MARFIGLVEEKPKKAKAEAVEVVEETVEVAEDEPKAEKKPRSKKQ